MQRRSGSPDSDARPFCMNCAACDAENSAERKNCWRCGTALVAAVSGNIEALQKSPGVRFRIALPIGILTLLLLLIGAYARWHSSRAPESTTEAAAEPDQQRIDQALERVPLVNARANDLLRAGKIDEALKIIEELLAVVDAPDLQETKVHLLVKAERHNEAYEL